jgi:RNA polymerase sigma-70 factor (ECF subfamily)
VAESESFEKLRPRMFGIAYRMLGSANDAEDIVQEAFLRYQGALRGGTEIGSLRAYLSAVVTRLSIDHLRSARVRREDYFGVWLPEPLLADAVNEDPTLAAEEADSLSMAFLLLLERLGPVERAAFLLHDVFGYGYDEIARIVGKGEANCRQIVARARERIQADRPRYEATPEQRERLAAQFFAAITSGDLDGLVQLLAEDAVIYGDGGGKVPQLSKPVVGAIQLARLLTGWGRQMRQLGLRFLRRRVNGQPGAVLVDQDGLCLCVFALEIDQGAVRTVRSVINPDKLRHLGPVADAWALQRRLTGEQQKREI